MTRPTIAAMAALQRELDTTKGQLARARSHAARLMMTSAELHDAVLTRRGVEVNCSTVAQRDAIHLAASRLVAALTISAEGSVH